MTGAEEYLPPMDGEEAERLNVGRDTGDKIVVEINSRIYRLSIKEAVELSGRIMAAVLVSL